MTKYDGETVDKGEVLVGYIIRAYTVDDETKYDWVSDADDSDEWFESIPEAHEDARTRLGG